MYAFFVIRYGYTADSENSEDGPGMIYASYPFCLKPLGSEDSDIHTFWLQVIPESRGLNNYPHFMALRSHIPLRVFVPDISSRPANDVGDCLGLQIKP